MWTSPSFKENIGGLTVIQAVYAFAMALGLREVFLGSRTFMTNVAFSPDGFSLERVLLLSALLLNMMLLGLRFFWVPRNLRGLIFAAVKARGHQGGRLSADGGWRDPSQYRVARRLAGRSAFVWSACAAGAHGSGRPSGGQH